MFEDQKIISAMEARTVAKEANRDISDEEIDLKLIMSVIEGQSKNGNTNTRICMFDDNGTPLLSETGNLFSLDFVYGKLIELGFSISESGKYWLIDWSG